MSTAEEPAETTPAGEVREAVERLRMDTSASDATPILADLLEELADQMGDDRAVERDFPHHIPGRQRLVVDDFGSSRDDWMYALRLARVINGEQA
jgi:hypothetical protein